MSDEFQKKMRAAREARGITQLQVAHALGVTRAAVGQWESGATKPSYSKLVLLNQLLGLDDKVRALKPKMQLSQRESFNLLGSRHKIAVQPYDVPVNTMVIDELGTCISHDELLDHLFRPTYLQSDNSSYGVSIVSEALYPRFEVGEKIYVSANEEPGVGDYTIITIVNEDARTVRMLRRVSGMLDNLVQTEVFQPHNIMTVPRSIIVSMHRVIPWSELLNLRNPKSKRES